MRKNNAYYSVSKEMWADYYRLLRLAFPEKYRATGRAWYYRNPEKIRAKCEKRNTSGKAYEAVKRYVAKHRGKVNRKRRIKSKQRYREDVRFRLRQLLSGRIKDALLGKAKQSSTINLLGCSLDDFKIYLESKFETGMSWENYGGGWHIDHIMPCAIFDLSKPEHQKRCFHFSNMQPLWAADNIRKGKTITNPQFNLL